MSNYFPLGSASEKFKNIKISRVLGLNTFAFVDPLNETEKVLKIIRNNYYSFRHSVFREKHDFKKYFEKYFQVMKCFENCPNIFAYENYYLDLEKGCLYVIQEKMDINLCELLESAKVLEPALLEKLIDAFIDWMTFSLEKGIIYLELHPDWLFLTRTRSFIFNFFSIHYENEFIKEFITDIYNKNPVGTMTNFYRSPEIYKKIYGIGECNFYSNSIIYSFGMIILFCSGASLTLAKDANKLIHADKEEHALKIEFFIKEYIVKSYPWYEEVIRKSCTYEPKDRIDFFQFKNLIYKIRSLRSNIKTPEDRPHDDLSKIHRCTDLDSITDDSLEKNFFLTQENSKPKLLILKSPIMMISRQNQKIPQLN